MFRRSSLVLLVVAGCGGAEPHDTTATSAAEDVGCPSEASPERCSDLASAAEGAGHGELAWAYTVLECESPTGAQCVAMWQRYAKLAPTQTDALDVLHTACDHLPAACAQLAAWHTERGHTLAAAAYQKRVAAAQPAQAGGAVAASDQMRAANALALATDLAAVMHVTDASPRTDTIAQMVGHELRAPAAAKPHVERKAWKMHAAELGSSSDACAAKTTVDKHAVEPHECVSEVRPFEADQIALRNRCAEAVSVAYAGARADHSTAADQLRLRPYEARSLGISHRDVGPLTYAVCPDTCSISGSPDSASASWTGQDARYYCTR